jgi:HlyD family secretion protein
MGGVQERRSQVFAEAIVKLRQALRLTRRRGQMIILCVIPVVFGFAVWGSQGGTAAQADPATAIAERGDLVKSVGGVGRIVQARASGLIARPSSGGTGGSGSGSGSGSAAASADTSPDAVFPRTSGRIKRYAVRRGQRVVAGQVLAALDDGGAAASAVRQARNALSTARIELRQKQTSDPLKGIPATGAELTAAQVAITAAEEKLKQLLGNARRADISAAWLEVRRAEADLETLRGGTAPARGDAIRVARRNLEAAQDRLQRALTPDAADVATATADLRKAEADLAELLRAPDGPTAEEIAAARTAVANAEQTLAEAKAAVPPVQSQIRSAQLELDRARADLAVLQKKPRGPTDEAIVAAKQAVETARAKLAKILRPGGSPDVALARAEVEKARAELRRLQAGPSRAALANARAAVEAAEAKLNQLLGPPLRADVAAARLEVRRAQADLSLLRTRGAPGSPDDIGLADLRVDAAQIQLETALMASRLLKVRAPSSGTVTSLLSVPGAPVDTTTPIASVSDLDRLAVSINLSEFDVALVRPGQKAELSVDALGGESFPGRVLFAAATGVEANGLVTFPVQITIDDAEGLKQGMNVVVRIVVAQKRDALQVPIEAVKEEGDDMIVTVLNAAGEPSDRVVELGLQNTKNVEILKGVREGERVEIVVAPEEE